MLIKNQSYMSKEGHQVKEEFQLHLLVPKMLWGRLIPGQNPVRLAYKGCVSMGDL